MPDQLSEALSEFARFARSLRGDEKSEAQSFLDHFFRALGHAGVIEAGATFEFRVAKKPGSAQLELIKGSTVAAVYDRRIRSGTTVTDRRYKTGKKFADLLWPDRVLIEMKTRGANLEKHYDQLFDYWSHIVPKRPPYAILCNFDEFWIYDFNIQLFDPVDKVSLGKLSQSISAFNFLLPHPKQPIFDNNRVEVTRRAADTMARVFKEIILRGQPRERAQRFILQLLVSMVAEDIGLLPNEIVTEMLFECSEKGASSYDLFGGLFRQMATKERAHGGRFQDIQYFNGGLFEVVDPIELKHKEVYALYEAGRENWSKIRPEIFGTLFQDSMDKKERHAFGAHFTSEFDIRKVVGPTIVRPWRERIDAAGKNVGELRKALADLRRFRVLDPACGSGNFLFIAYREMKRLERDLLLRLREVSRREPLESAISLHQFFGIDIIPFAVELAKVTLMLAKTLELEEAKKLAQDGQLLIEEHPLPLANLDNNIKCADALFADWPKADAIIGNPPFQSKNKAQKEVGVSYLRRLRSAFPQIPGRADLCVYWLRRAHDYLESGQHAGLVGTNTIRQNYSREGGLDYIVDNAGVIIDAVATQVWSGDAVVHVSIVNWTKSPQKSEIERPKRLTLQKGDNLDSPWETFEPSRINSALSPGTDVTNAKRLDTNAKSGACYQGQTHGHEGFLLTPSEASEMIRHEPRSAEVLFPYLTADELIGGIGSQPSRFVIDLQPRGVFAASRYERAITHIRATVLPAREKAANEELERNKELSTDSKRKGNKHHANFLKRWWLLSYPRGELIERLAHLTRYISCGRVTKRPIFEFVSTTIRPNDALMVFPLSDDYSFGILQSILHFDWFKARCSTLKGDFRYTSDSVFDTFPWPQNPTREQIAAVASEAVSLRALRRDVMDANDWSLRDLYRTLEQPGDNPLREAHARLDAAVRTAYGMHNDAEPLAFLLELNLKLAAKEKAKKQIIAPGLPPVIQRWDEFVTDDCIEAQNLPK